MHSESDTEPACTVILGGGRLTVDNRTDSRRIDVTFKMCYHDRVGPHHDNESVESIGYEIVDSFSGEMNSYLDWRSKTWRESGHCPDSGFYIAEESEWLPELPDFFQQGFRHYVLDGRDGYVELVATQFAWQEWMWSTGHRDDAPSKGPVVGSGQGVA